MNKPTRPFHFLQVWYPVALTVVLTCLSLGLIGLNVAGRLRGDFASPPTPLATGWRRWDDDGDWDT